MQIHQLRTDAQQLQDTWIDLRRKLHTCPEPGRSEVQTAQIVCNYLDFLGIPYNRVAETGIVALIQGEKKGPCVALRAELDALAQTETADVPFASQNPGYMHACGHDFHMAALLGAAQLLVRHRKDWGGCVKLLFQPDEEGNGGAARMIAQGCLDNPHVDAVFGMHVLPQLPAGTAAIRYGPSFAASDMFEIRVTGRACHGAEPHKGIDALAAACRIVEACAQMRAQRFAPTDALVISFGTLHAGTAGNVIAQEAVLTGIIRTLGASVRENVRQAFVACVQAAAAQNGAKAQVTLRESYPGIVCQTQMTDLVKEAALQVQMPLVQLETPTMMTEDFGYFLQHRSGSFYHIGVGCQAPLHSGAFCPDESALVPAVLLHVCVVDCALENGSF